MRCSPSDDSSTGTAWTTWLAGWSSPLASRRRIGDSRAGGHLPAFPRERAGADGGIRNRLGADLMWEDSADVKDCWGRALWGLGTAAARSSSSRLASEALDAVRDQRGRRSRWTRAMAFAAVGAAEVLTVHPDHGMARALLADAASSSTRWARRRRGPPPTGTGRRAACGTPTRSFPRRCSPLGTFSMSHAGSHADWTCSDGFSMSRQPVSTSLHRLQADGRGASPGRASTSSPSRSQPWRTPVLGPRHHRAPPVGRRSASVRRMVRGNQRHRDPDGRPGERGRLRRPRSRRPQREPGAESTLAMLSLQLAGRLRADDRTGRSLVRSL